MVQELLIDITPSPRNGKKYRATVYNPASRRTRIVDFGALGYQHYRDSTPLRTRRYAYLNHNDPVRRRAYFLRHSRVASKNDALAVESAKSKGRITARLLSHWFLW